MASSSDKDASCANDPDFAVICAFLEKFSEQLQVNYPDFKQLQEWISNTDEVPNGLRDLHIKLMRKIRRTVHECAWESALSKFCFFYSSQDGWEIERFGYKKSSLRVKLRILRELLESQFIGNNKFRAKLLTMTADSLRSEPIGRDRLGHSYWMTQDPECNIRIYQEHLDEEIWQVVATNREEFVKLISRLKGNEVVLPSEIGLIDEDSSSNSCSALIEKPPPPEEKDDSQESNQSTGRIPNIKIKLGNKENGNIATCSNEPEEGTSNNSVGVVEKEEEKKVKPLVISHSKIKMEKTKKRSLDECDKNEPVEVKKQRPSLLDPKREKKVGRYEQQEEEDDEHDDGGEEEEEEDGEEEDEEDADSDEAGEEDDEDDLEDDEDIGLEEEDFDEDEDEVKNEVAEKENIANPSESKHKPTKQAEVFKKSEEDKFNKEAEESKANIKEEEITKSSTWKDEAMIEDKLSKEKEENEKIAEEEEEKIAKEKEKTAEEEQEKTAEEEKEKVAEEKEAEEKELKEDIKCEGAAKDIANDDKADEQTEKADEQTEKADEEVEKAGISRDQDEKAEPDIIKQEPTKEEVPPIHEKSVECDEKDSSENADEISKEANLTKDDIDVNDFKTAELVKVEKVEEEPVVGEPLEDPPIVFTEEGSGAECESSFFRFLSAEEPEVSKTIEESVMFVFGEGSGKESLIENLKTTEFEGDCYLFNDEAESKLEFSEEIEDAVIFVVGDGSGADCSVGNAKTSEAEPEATFFFGQPGCLKLSPVKNQSKSDESENCNENDKEEEEEEGEAVDGKKVPESTNGDSHLEVEEKKSAKASPDKNKIKTDFKNGDKLDERRTSRQVIVNRKRRLSEDKPEKAIAQRLSSESETDLNSENLEDPLIDDEEEDIGGKRLKMRSKQVNTEIRKKVEAQRNNATVEETTTSSSGEEEAPRKKVAPKKIEKEVPPQKPKGKQIVKPNLEIPTVKEPQEDLTKVEKDPLENLPEKPGKSNEKPNPPQLEEVIEKEPPKKRTGRSANKQIKKPAVASNDDADDETPKADDEKSKKKLVSEPTSKEGSPTNLEVKAEKSPDSDKGKIIVTVGEDHTLDKQRKRRSSEEDKKEATPPPLVALKTTRSSRRGGPPEQVYELPQIKRTRVKAVEKITEKTEIKSKVLKVEDPIRKEVPQTEEVKKEEEPQVKKEEPEVKKEAVPPTPTKVPLAVTPRPRQQAAQKQPATSTGQRRKCHDDVDAKNIIDLESDTTPVRMSRRIAQLKIREEADRRKMEEIALRNMKAELKKKKKAEGKPEDPTVSEPSEHSSDQAESEVEVKKKTEKKKKCPGKGGWSSGSEEPDEEEAEEHPYSDHGSPLFRSDHEFSPESELEDESQVVPLKRARTARKEGEEEVEAHSADESCQKCGKSDHPEWILLCDKCNKGYHCSCLSPVIFYIPEGDWFCPPCQQESLIVALENHLKEFDGLVQRKKDEEEERIRKEELVRLELEKAAQEKVEKKNERKQDRKKKAKTKAGASRGRGGRSNARKKKSSDDDHTEEENKTETDSSSSSKSNSSSGSGSSKSSSASDSDDEPIYKLRKRRQINVSYRLNEYDEMIKSALKKEEDAVAGAGNLGRGKDISNIIEAGIDEEPHNMVEENGALPPVSAPPAEDSGSDFGPLKRKPKSGRHMKKKHRKLTKLDISSEGDNDSDEDFKTSSMDDEEEDDDEEEASQSSDSSLDVYRRRRGNRKSKKKKTRRAARHSARERRKDRKFIVDDSDADGSEEEKRPRSKKKRKKDSDYTESETNDDDDDELSENINSEDLCDDSTDSEASDGAWRPSKRKKQRSSGIARKSPKLKPKVASKAKKTKRLDDNSPSFKAGISGKHRMIDDDDSDDDSDDSVDSSRKTRGKRCMYLEDYDDDSSDGGIKPGVKRPDTPPEEREKFIKKQEEIKRMLAEKNAEGAKLAATPRLIPIKTGAQRSPAKLDSLSTVPLSVIRQAKVLDIDYLQRKGESISEEGDMDESEFDDDDLPDDFNPEDMDEEAIARMVEEEDFAQQQQLKLPLPSEVLRKKPAKEQDPVVRPVSTFMPPQAQQSTSVSGLQEPVRKKLPMPTMHPPLLRHGYGPPMMQQNRQPHLPLLQNALSAPLNHPMSRNFPPTTQAIPATNQGVGGMTGNASGDLNKPRGRRKKITPLRDPLQKQQAAAAAAAAAVAASKPRPENLSASKPETRAPPAPIAQNSTPGVIKSALSIAQPPQLYKPPSANTQPSVITRMPHLQGRPMMTVGGGPPFGEHGSRFYRPPHPQSHLRPPPPSSQPQQQAPPPQRPPQPSQPQHRPPPSQSQQPPLNSLIAGNRPPMRHRGPPMPPMTSHHSLRPSFVSGPPPLRPSSSGGAPISLANDIAREQGPPRQSSAYSAPEQQYTGPPPPARHSAPPPPHLSPYRPQMYNNPGFPHRGPPTNSSQPSAMRPGGPPPEYTSPGSYVGGYGYYPPPLSVPHSAPPPPTASAVPSSVIVSASSLSATTSVVVAPPLQPVSSVLNSRPPASSSSLIEKQCTPVIAAVPPTTNPPSVIELSRKKLTTLETFNKSKTATPPPLRESSESRSPYSSNPPTVCGPDDAPEDNSASPPASSQSTSEFSGLVSYFSSQHDDLNT